MKFKIELLLLSAIGVLVGNGVLYTVYKIERIIKGKKQLAQRKKVRKIQKQARERVIKQYEEHERMREMIQNLPKWHAEIDAIYARRVR